MPALIVAVVAAAAAYGAGALVGSALAGTALAAALGATGVAVVTSIVGGIAGAIVAYAGNALVASLENRPAARRDTTSLAADAKRTIRSEVAPRRIVYGRARVSGPLIYAGSFGVNLEYLLLVIPLCDHEVEAIDAVWIGEHRIDGSEIAANGDVIAGRFATPAPPYNPFAPPVQEPATVSIRRLLGNQTQADPQLVAECPDGWTAEDRLTGIAHLVVRLRYHPDLFQSGIPSISAEVRGRKVLDPRTNQIAYSENWALIIYDYLRSEHGLAASEDEIDISSIIVAANLSDEAVQIDAGGTTQPRYTLNGTFTLDRRPIDVLEDMLAPGGGALVYTAGKYRLFGGAYQAPVVTLTAADLASDVEVVTKPPRRELFNSVRGHYIEPSAYWQAYPIYPLQWAPFIAEDGEEIWRELELPFVLDGQRAVRVAKQLLLRSRQGVTIKAAVKYANLDLSVWQMVAVTLPHLGWDEKPFRIIAWSFDAQNGLITLTMQEEQITSYAWTYDETAFAPEHPDTTLIDPFNTPAPIGLAMTEELYVTRDGAGVRTKAVLSWAPPATPFIAGYDIEYKPASETVWRAAGGVVEPRGEVLDLAAGIWDFRVRVRTTVGRGEWASLRASVGALAAQPPGAVTGLTIQSIGGLAFLRWKRSQDLDVRVGGHFEIRHSPNTAGASWASSTSIGDAIAGEATFALLPLKKGVYFIRAVDAGGVYGPVAQISTAQATVLQFANVATVTEHPTFSGTNSGTVVVNNKLRLASGAAYGAYTFSVGIDLTTVRPIRLTSRLVAFVFNDNDEWDDRTTLIDTWPAVDGVFGGEADAWVESRYTNGDPNGSPTWTGWQRLDSAEFIARAFQFRVQLRSYNLPFNIDITELSVSADEVV